MVVGYVEFHVLSHKKSSPTKRPTPWLCGPFRFELVLWVCAILLAPTAKERAREGRKRDRAGGGVRRLLILPVIPSGPAAWLTSWEVSKSRTYATVSRKCAFRACGYVLTGPLGPHKVGGCKSCGFDEWRNGTTLAASGTGRGVVGGCPFLNYAVVISRSFHSRCCERLV